MIQTERDTDGRQHCCAGCGHNNYPNSERAKLNTSGSTWENKEQILGFKFVSSRVRKFWKTSQIGKNTLIFVLKTTGSWSSSPTGCAFSSIPREEKALSWARQHETKYKSSTLRIYADISSDLTLKRASFKKRETVAVPEGYTTPAAS